MIISKFLKELRWLRFTLGRKLAVQWYRLRRLFVQPALPNNPDGKVRVHLGCGDVEASGFINVDLKPGPHVHFLHSVTELPFLQNEAADLVYACHVLEHFPAEMVGRVLWEWRRVLKVGGILRLSVPDFDLLLHVYGESDQDVESIRQPLLGVPDGYYSHLQLFNFNHLKRLLEAHGFSHIRRWDPDQVGDHQFQDWANRPISFRERSFLISLNVEAEKHS